MATEESSSNNTNNKRKRSKDSVEENPSRSATISSSKSNSYQASFLSCHFKMLRVLYVEDDDDATSSLTTDGAVSHEVWEMIGRFLMQRCEMTRTKKQAQRWRIIVEEANDLFEIPPDDVSTKPATPVGKRLFASPLSCRSNSAIKKQSGSTDDASLSRSSATVSWLLKHRARVEEQKTKTVVQPFYDLYTAVCQRAQRLTTILEQQSNNNESDEAASSSQSRNEARETRIELDAKQRLWKMLANDLYHVIQID